MSVHLMNNRCLHHLQLDSWKRLMRTSHLKLPPTIENATMRVSFVQIILYLVRRLSYFNVLKVLIHIVTVPYVYVRIGIYINLLYSVHGIRYFFVLNFLNNLLLDEVLFSYSISIFVWELLLFFFLFIIMQGSQQIFYRQRRTIFK